MRKRIAMLVMLGVLGGLTACGGEVSSPPAEPPEPVVSASPSPALEPEVTDVPEEVPEAAAEMVQYYDMEQGDIVCLSEEAFLNEHRFGDQQPFHTYRMEEGYMIQAEDGTPVHKMEMLCMDLYYDVETGQGCGLWYREVPGEEPVKRPFWFEETVIADGGDLDDWSWEMQWNRWRMDYFHIPEWENSFAEDYQEHYEYDEAGRVVSFLADGIYESPWETEDERNPVFRAEFFYDEAGNILERDFNQYVFGSSGMGQRSYFDSAERVVYEWVYMTHGSLEYYYIYEDDSREPAYCLILDHDVGPTIRAEFARYE